MNRLRVIPCILICALIFLNSAVAQSPAYLDTKLSFEQRAKDLVGLLTLEEKVAQLQNATPAIPRLGIPSYDWWNEGLHGMARAGIATVFPQAIGMASTWDTELIQLTGDTISTEARAKYHQAQREKNYSINYGLTLWSPNINIVRDPRWGRAQETYGEDPFLTGQIGSAFVRGLQGSDPKYLKTVATAKHFAVHSGPESARHGFNAVVSAHDLEDTYLPAFRQLMVNAKSESIMCAYNAVNGEPACASNFLLQKKLRSDWQSSASVVSDCGAIGDIVMGHHLSSDMPHAAASSLKTGTDLSCGREYVSLIPAVQQGLVSEKEIDAALVRLIIARFKLGMFDPQEAVPYSRIPISENNSPEHSKLALRAARESMVLLKNDGNILPLSRRVKTIAVIGPNADTLASLEGNYNGVPSEPITPLQALKKEPGKRILYEQGSPYVEVLPTPVSETVFHRSTRNAVPGLRAEFFANADFNSKPVFQRVDSRIQFDWNAAVPAPGVSPERFGVRWTGTFTPPVAGKYGFSFLMAHCSTCEDEEIVRVWLDEKQIYDFKHERTHGRRAPTTPFSFEFTDTKPHAIRVEYAHDAPHFGAGLTFNWIPPAAVLRERAVAAAKNADVVVAFLGLSPELEGEEMPIHTSGFDGGDRTRIELPDIQNQLIAELAKTGKPIVIVLMNGSAIALKDTEHRAAAILEAWYPGQAGGTAVVDTLFGRNNPGGRLPLTFYAGTEQLPSFSDYSMKNRTYRYFQGKPAYPFGYGLSYTHFDYSKIKLSSAQFAAGQPLTVDASVRNSGVREGDEVVQLYFVPKNMPDAPIRSLVAFKRIHLKPGESIPVRFTLDSRALSLVDANGTRGVQPGNYDLFMGGGPPEVAAGQSASFEITGKMYPISD